MLSDNARVVFIIKGQPNRERKNAVCEKTLMLRSCLHLFNIFSYSAYLPSLANPGRSVTLVAVVFPLKWVWLFSDIWMQKLLVYH